jgi:hypothetical protein
MINCIHAKEPHMPSHQTLAALFVCCALNACGGGPDEPREPMPVKDTVFGDTVGTMDKARAVEGTMRQRNDDLNEALEKGEEAH